MAAIASNENNTNAQGWSVKVPCSGIRNNGCGTELLVGVSHLYRMANLLCDTDEALFRCMTCGCMNKVKVPPGLNIKKI